MNSHEMQRAYGDSHTLDRPTVNEQLHLSRSVRRVERYNPLDSKAVRDTAEDQGWGS